MRWFILTLFLTSHALATTWRVTTDGSGDAPTIQAAIDSAATDGDLILVEPGTYYENLHIAGKDIWLKSTAGPAVTIIDGSNTYISVVRYTAEAGGTLEGFTVTGGNGGWNVVCGGSASGSFGRAPALESIGGGGIYILESSPTIRKNVFRGNQTDPQKFGYGGGMLVGSCRNAPLAEPLIEENLFIDNESSANGGAIAVSNAAPIITRNIFRNNYTEPGDGGAIWHLTSQQGRARITHNQFWDNEAYDHGGAIELSDDNSHSVIEHNLFVRNIGLSRDAPHENGSGGAIGMRPAYGSLRYNTFVGNVGSPEEPGGTILLSHALAEGLFIENNIIVGSITDAIRCTNRDAGVLETGIVVRNNLFWDNDPGHVLDSDDCILDTWMEENTIADPMFCGVDADNFTVAKDSPALTNGTPMGAFWNPGCGAGVPVQETTWGKIKALYHDGP